jgi:spoIIIJ-associated protein
MEEKTYTVSSIEEVKQRASADFGKKESELTFVIISERGGLFGDEKQYLIKVSDQVDGLDKGKEYIERILLNAGLQKAEFVIEKKVRNDEQTQAVEYNVNTKDFNGYLIGAAEGKGGHGGQNLVALQTLVSLVVNEYYDEHNQKKVLVDVGGFKKKRVQHLESLAIRCAKEVSRTKQDVTLTHLNSYERRIVHARVASWNNLKTRSEGEEPNRVLIISYAKEVKAVETVDNEE